MNKVPVVQLHDIEFRWTRRAPLLLRIPRFQLERGEHLFLLGPSGSGKSTLINLLAGIVRPNCGEVRLLDQPLSQWRGARRDRFRVDHIGLIFQQFNLLPYLSVLENTLLPCWFSARRRDHAARQCSIEQQAHALLSGLGLSDELLHQPVTALSVGQQQRVAVARALIGKPELIIADEPTSALDADTRDSFIKLLFEHAEDSTIIFVSHDRALAPLFHRSVSITELNTVDRG
ncbi:MAG TPA: ABC transporter ATP-binding protein [Spongiibacteraceae bacterium]|jgi:putative ABC transport system ATP-binding protein